MRRVRASSASSSVMYENRVGAWLWMSCRSPRNTVVCPVTLYRFLTLNMPGCQCWYEAQNHHPFPEASVMLKNLGVSFAGGIPGPSKSKSKRRNETLIWNASEECRRNRSYKEKEVQDLWTRKHMWFQGFHSPNQGWATPTTQRRKCSRMKPNHEDNSWVTSEGMRRKQERWALCPKIYLSLLDFFFIEKSNIIQL